MTYVDQYFFLSFYSFSLIYKRLHASLFLNANVRSRIYPPKTRIFLKFVAILDHTYVATYVESYVLSSDPSQIAIKVALNMLQHTQNLSEL